jgi:FkbM family methyltransferase
MAIGLVLVAATYFCARTFFIPPAVALAEFGNAGLREMEPIRAKYGPHTYSRGVEEWVIRDHFNDRRDGVFADVGAADYQFQSNTYYLEKHLGWSGVAIDAQIEYAAGYAANRPRSKFFAVFVSDAGSGGPVSFFVPTTRPLTASSNQAYANKQSENVEQREIPTTTLDAVLDSAGITRLDFVSMDIELSEPAALAGFDINRFKPSLVCIEAHPEVRQQILDYFAAHGYTVIGKYLRVDQLNLYFRPSR